MPNKVYEIVTSQIIEMLENGVIPWEKPWYGEGAPVNFHSFKEYRGINKVLLGMQPFFCPFWGTMLQINDVGGQVNKGEKSTLIVFWKFLEKERDTKDGEKLIDKIPYLRYYRVFNLEQTKGIPWEKWMPDYQKETIGELPTCEELVNGYKGKPVIRYSGNRAYYSPLFDYINLPEKQHFKSSEGFYSTLFHELVHSTGHANRINRKDLDQQAAFGSADYSREELVAEIGSMFLCDMAGIEKETIDNCASYIQSWLRALRNDVKMVVVAASRAQKAVDYMLGLQAGNSV